MKIPPIILRATQNLFFYLLSQFYKMKLFKKSNFHLPEVFPSQSDNHRILEPIFKKLKQKSQQNLSRYSQLPEDYKISRKNLFFKKIAKICHRLDAHHSTFALAISIFDRIALEPSFNGVDLSDLSLICLVIATKTRESAERAVSVKDLSVLLSTRNISQHNQMELLVLNSLGFDSNIVLPYDLFLPMFRLTTAHKISQITKRGNPPIRPSSLLSKLFYLTALETSLGEFSSLVLACSILLVFRLLFGIKPYWSKHLLELTGFEIKNLLPCVEQLQRCFNILQSKRA